MSQKPIANTIDIFDKVEIYDIRHAPIIPTIDIPNCFGDEKISKEDAYLEYLSFSKAKQIYGESLPEDVSDRLKFELEVIKKRGAFRLFSLSTGCSQYRSIRAFGVWVGPGRGSAGIWKPCMLLFRDYKDRPIET